MGRRSPMDDGGGGFGTVRGWLTAFALGGLLFLVGQSARCSAEENQRREPAPVVTTR